MHEKKSVLIIDDDISLLRIMETGLSSQDYQCETAADAETALELLKKDSFDIMITDIVMPGMDGFELTEKAKRLRPDMLIIIMTGFVEDFSYDRAIQGGASDFIKKPFTLQELIIRLQLVKFQEKLLRMSVTDELTGLYNRRGFFTLADQQFKISGRLKHPIYLLFADLDGLKGINDQFGHQEGDEALIRASKVLIDTFRQSDIIARIGGDEFVVIPIGTTEEGAGIAISRLYKTLELCNANSGNAYELSLSVGLACYNPADPCSVDELVSRADRSMYEQKKQKKTG